jgi:transposase
MHPTLSTQCFTVISLLQVGYSLHQVQSKTGLGKSTISRIKKEMDWDKENSKEGCSSKLFPHNKQLIIHQITTGKLNNAV